MKKENYLCLNGQKIELTEEQLTKIRDSVVKKTRLSEKEVGEIVTIGEYEYIVLEQNKFVGTTSLLMKELLEDGVKFSDTDCDFKTSIVKTKLEAFADKIVGVIGTDNLITHTVDLTANDGLKDYGNTTAKVSLLTADLYRRYVEILDNFKIDKWWWLVTPYSTEKHGYTQYVMCVVPSGNVGISNYRNFNNGVRPFCILNSNIFVS